MSTPRNYTPTTKNIAPYYRTFFSASIDANGKITQNNVETVIKFGQDNGCTYTFGLVEMPTRWFPGDPQFAALIGGSRNTTLPMTQLAAQGQGKRALQPYVWNNQRMYEFLEDQMGSTYQTAPRNLYIRNTWAIQSATGSLENPWMIGAGVCSYHDIWNKVIGAAKAQGVTFDYVLLDMEGTNFGAYSIAAYQGDARRPLAIIGSTYYDQEWQGLCSWKYYFENGGGSTNFGIGGHTLFNFGQINNIPWDNAASKYVGKMFTIAHYDILKAHFPNVYFSNYGVVQSDPIVGVNGITFDYFGQIIGNASSGLFYTVASNLNIETNAQGWIQEKNPSAKLVGPSSPLRGRKGVGILSAPRYAFMGSLQGFREQKRNAYNNPNHPWIGAVNTWTEGYPGTVWTIGSASQSDANVLTNSWNIENISSLVRGITAPDGSTGAFVIRTAQTNGATFTLDYFLNGTTPGTTYTFSYYIDLSRGFTAPLFKIQNWKPYYSYESSGQGLTYTQILPFVGSPTFKEGLVGFTSGNSGWTKVAFQFIGTTNPYLALTSLYGKNASASGYTSYIWNPSLEIEYSGGNTASIGITAFDAKRFTVSDRVPPIAFADAQKGYNPKLDAYFTRRSGNSGYYYETLRHFMLMGAQVFGYFNGTIFIDYSLGGVTAQPGQDFTTFFNAAATEYNLKGGTNHTRLLKDFNNCIDDVNSRIGGFTLTTAMTGWENWLGDYAVNGAPGLNGTTWWWRITALPGATTYCNGVTLSSNGTIGTWVTTTGPTLAGVCLYSQKWAYPSEPGITSPTVDYNFTTMSSITDLTNAGFTYIRGSTATYINNQGKLVVVTGNTPRFAFDPDTLQPKGIMLEPNGTNQLNWSESFANTGGINNNWVDFNLQRTTGNTSPSDSLNAIRFTATGSNATLLSSNAVGLTRERCLSFWMRGVTGNESVFYTFNNGITWNAITNLSTRWKRFEYGPNTGNHTVGFRIGNTGNSVLIWGAQLERSKSEMFDSIAIPGLTTWSDLDVISSSYIPTQGATAQRNGDLLYMPVAGFSGWLGLTQGTFVYEAENMHQGTFNILRNNSTWYGLEVRTTNDAYMNVTFGNHPTYITGAQSSPWFNFYPYRQRASSTIYKIAFNYKPQRVGISANGIALTTSPLANFPGFEPTYQGGAGWVTALYFTGFSSGATSLHDSKYAINPMFIRRLRYWNKPFEESLMKVITLADIGLRYVDDSVQYTFEKYNEIRDMPVFTIENASNLT